MPTAADDDLATFLTEQEKHFTYTSEDEREFQKLRTRLESSTDRGRQGVHISSISAMPASARSAAADRNNPKSEGAMTIMETMPRKFPRKRKSHDVVEPESSSTKRKRVQNESDGTKGKANEIIPSKNLEKSTAKSATDQDKRLKTNTTLPTVAETKFIEPLSTKRKRVDESNTMSSAGSKQSKPLTTLPVPEPARYPPIPLPSHRNLSPPAPTFTAPMDPLPLEIAQTAYSHRIAKSQPRLVRVSPAKPKAPAPHAASTSDSASASTSKKTASPSRSKAATIVAASASASTPLNPPAAKKPRRTVDSGRLTKVQREEKKRKEAEKKVLEAREKKMTPKEYAEWVPEKFKGYREPPQPGVFHCEGLVIYYCGGELRDHTCEQTRKRMNLIQKRGGVVQPVFDPETCTHIVTDVVSSILCKSLRIKSLREIPIQIPIVRWSWMFTNGHEFQHAAYSKRMPEIRMPEMSASNRNANSKGKGKGKETPADSAAKGKEKAPSRRQSVEFSRISEFTEDDHDSTDEEDEIYSRTILDTPALGLAKGEGKTSPPSNSDPLAEFYDQARADREAGVDDDSDQEGPKPVIPSVKKSGFACDNIDGSAKRTCPNQDVIDKLCELRNLHQSKPTDDDRWKTYTYNRAIGALRNYPKPITSLEEARAIRGIGEKTALKIMEIIETGNLRRIQYERTEDVVVMEMFRGIYGVGPTVAQTWYNRGCRTLADIRNRVGGITVSFAQEIGLRFYDDINDRMPRAEAEAIFKLIKPVALKIDPLLFIEIMGSFRRGKATCGDIDILITRDYSDGRTHAGILRRLLTELHRAGILTEDLSLPEDMNDLENCYRGLCRKDEKSRRRRIDILTVPYDSRGGALLYYTGDDIFNRSMRLKANKMGYSLNQRGLYEGIVRNPSRRTEKLNAGNIIASKTEEEIFKILGVPWQEPHQRVRG